MDTIHWSGLTRAIVDLCYDSAAGSAVVLLEGGDSLLVSADWDGCNITHARVSKRGKYYACFELGWIVVRIP